MRPQVHPQVHNVLSTFLCEVLLWQPLHDMTMDPDNHLRREECKSMHALLFGRKTAEHCLFAIVAGMCIACITSSRKLHAPCLDQMHSQQRALPAEMFAATQLCKHVCNSMKWAEAATEG